MSKFSLTLSTLFLAILGGAYWLGHFPQEIVIFYLAASVITFFAYALDKSKAKRGAWRTPESTLHFFALVGGWPGAAFAQQILRHKSKKSGFRNMFWVTVIVNISAFSWLISTYGKEALSLFS